MCLSMNIFFATCLYSQYKLPEVTMPSPTAAALGLYGEVPVNLFAGLPQISVPLYELKELDLSVPISLSYHASGVRPDQHPGWVGLNWSLNAGGVITRVTKDLPDEYDCPNNTLNAYHYGMAEFNGIANSFDIGMSAVTAGYYFNRNVNQGNDWADPSKINNLVTDNLDGKDTEPDEFNFNFLGYTGKFFLDEAGEWQVMSESNITVRFQNNFIDLPSDILVSQTKHYQAFCSRRTDNLKSFGGFTLTTDDGTQYIFGSTPSHPSIDAIEYSVPFFQQMFDQWIATSWYLTRIISPNGNEIAFKYEHDDFISNMYIYYLWKVEIFLNNNNNVPCELYGQRVNFGTEGEVTADWINPKYAPYLGNLIRPIYLKEIETTHTKVILERSTSAELRYDNEIYMKNIIIANAIRANKVILQLCYGADPSPEYNIYWPFLYDVIQTSNHRTLLNALRWKKLDNIKIVNKNDLTEGHQYTLSYNNFANERLSLKSIAKKSINGLLDIKYYRFKYYNDPTINLPGYFSEQTDHWGFLNDNLLKGFTALRTPQYTDNGPPNIDVIHEPTTSTAKAVEGSLKSIQYPTGGETTFEYEQHRYSKVFDITNCDNTIGNCIVNENAIAGGLRIKKITSKSSPTDDKPLVKEYFYVTGYNPSVNINTLSSSGILGGKSQYFWQDYQPKVQNTTVKKIKRTIISSQSVLPLSINSAGTHVGYSEVVEKRNDGAYILYKFTNFVGADGNHFDEKPEPGSYNDLTPYTVVNDRSHERGNLLFKETYSTTGKPVNKYKATYSTYSSKFVRALFLTSNTYPCIENNSFTAYLGIPYKLFVYRFLKSKEETTDYNAEGTNPITKVTDHNYYIYNNSNVDYYLPSEDVSYGVNSSEYVSKSYRYPDKYLNNPVARSMVLAYNMLGVPIETITKKNDQVIGASVTLFNCLGCQVGPNQLLMGGLIKPVQTYELETKTPLTNYSFATDAFPIVPDARCKPKAFFDSYGPYGNLQQFHKADNINTSYIWGYKNTLPIAEINGASYTDVTNAAISAGFVITDFNTTSLTDQQVRDKIQLLRVQLPNAQIVSYTYNPFLGVTSKTSANGVVECYEYDLLGRLKLIKDANNHIVKAYDYNYQVK